MAKIGILTIHGMGRQGPNFDRDLRERLSRRLDQGTRDDVVFQEVFFQDLLQGNQDRVWAEMDLAGGWFPWPWRKLWARAREFLLFGFSDAASYLNRPAAHGSAYQVIHGRTRDAIDQLAARLGDEHAPAVIIGHSLGCQVISNYIWDAQSNKGIWSETNPPTNFQKLGTAAYFFSAGCNIPLFVSGLDQIQAIQPPNDRFRWINYYDKDDVLGWPLEPLSTSYRQLVEDVELRARGLLRWTPASHTEYWRSGSFLKPVARLINELHAQP